jgi:uncharacterized membrane protein
VDFLFSQNPLWILYAVFFMMIFNLANGQENSHLGSLSVVGIAILTLIVGWHQEQTLDALFGLLGGLILGVVIPLIIKIR